MSRTTLIGCADNGAAYCLKHCPGDSRAECEIVHGAIFEGDEVDCAPDTRDVCREPIEGETILHHFVNGACIYCEISDEVDE